MKNLWVPMAGLYFSFIISSLGHFVREDSLHNLGGMMHSPKEMFAVLWTSRNKQVTCWQLIWASNLFFVYPCFYETFCKRGVFSPTFHHHVFQNSHIKVEILSE